MNRELEIEGQWLMFAYPRLPKQTSPKLPTAQCEPGSGTVLRYLNEFESGCRKPANNLQ
jgi:hypothetical protein